MPVSSLMAAVFSIITMLQAGQLPGASWGVPSLLQPQGGQTYCFLSCAALVRVRVARVSEPATTNSLRFIGVVLSKSISVLRSSARRRQSSLAAAGREDVCSEMRSEWEERRESGDELL